MPALRTPDGLELCTPQRSEECQRKAYYLIALPKRRKVYDLGFKDLSNSPPCHSSSNICVQLFQFTRRQWKTHLSTKGYSSKPVGECSHSRVSAHRFQRCSHSSKVFGVNTLIVSGSRCASGVSGLSFLVSCRPSASQMPPQRCCSRKALIPRSRRSPKSFIPEGRS